MNTCHADRDGECSWAECPQVRDNEPATSVRHCPLDDGDMDGPGDVATDNIISQQAQTFDRIPSDREIAEAAQAMIVAEKHLAGVVRATKRTFSPPYATYQQARACLLALVARCPEPDKHYHIISGHMGDPIGCTDGATYRDVLEEEPGVSFRLVGAETCVCKEM